MLRVGLTGGIASGKTTVARMMESRGAFVVQADLIAHELMNPGESVYEEVVKRFGQSIVNKNDLGSIDRAKLGQIVFGEERIGELNQIIHPVVIKRQEEWMEEIGKKDPMAVAVVEAALILEAGVNGRFDKLVVVACPEEERRRRFLARAAELGISEEQNNISVYKRVLPSVVNITTSAVAYDFFYGAVPTEGQGSGFIIDKEGHILTNFHVIANSREVAVTLSNQKTYKAEIIGTDPSHDLAVIKINASDIVPVTLGDSKNLVVGQKVYCIGNPFGLNGTLTTGIVSSLRSIRSLDGTPIDDAIQTDAAVNPGNSGGPMLNAKGEVIGINFQIATNGVEQSAGIGFAIPINA